jgi:hypothetical protein
VRIGVFVRVSAGCERITMPRTLDPSLDVRGREVL